ncbi:LysR family transcriptional regulator [Nostoc sp.]|uniref:LysR family transcriptional regulator n=1 Tax=Nostoc sp. TaxID=1180 RepID=UPI002FF92457
MELRDLNAFLVLAEELNFRKAAARLHLTQPPLTRLVHRLEAQLGVQLFERSTTKVELTRSGIILYEGAKDLINQAERLKQQVSQSAKNSEGILRVGFSALVEGRINLDGVQTQLIHREDFGILMSKTHRLGKKKLIRFADLHDETFIFQPRRDNPQFYDSFLTLLRDGGIEPKLFHKKPNQECPLLVSSGAGILLTTRTLSKFATKDLRFIPLLPPRPQLEISSVWLDGFESPQLKLFLSFIKQNSGVRIQNELF